MGNKYSAVKKKWIYYSFAAPIIKFEKRAHGWHYEGYSTRTETKYSVDNDGYLKKETNVFTHACFSRTKAWKTNPLFLLNETLSRLVSFVRRWAISASPIVIIVCLIALFLTSGEDHSWIWIPIGIYGGLIAASLILAGLAILWRSVFKIDQRTDEDLEAHGYSAWSTDPEGMYF